MEIKKSNSVDLEKKRLPVFLVSLTLVLSIAYVVFEWHSVPSDPDIEKMMDDLEQDLDLQAMKEKEEMVAAITEEEPHKIATTTENVQPEETVKQVQEVEPVETTTSEIIVNEEKPVVEEAKVEEVTLDQVQEDSQVAEETHFSTVEELPEFPGGHSAFIKWINDNLKYPQSAIKNKKQGKLVISFVVDATGAIKDLKLLQKFDYDTEMAAMRLFMKMPKWKPGMKNGKPCATMIAVPINFEI